MLLGLSQQVGGLLDVTGFKTGHSGKVNYFAIQFQFGVRRVSEVAIGALGGEIELADIPQVTSPQPVETFPVLTQTFLGGGDVAFDLLHLTVEPADYFLVGGDFLVELRHPLLNAHFYVLQRIKPLLTLLHFLLDLLKFLPLLEDVFLVFGLDHRDHHNGGKYSW